MDSCYEICKICISLGNLIINLVRLKLLEFYWKTFPKYRNVRLWNSDFVAYFEWVISITHMHNSLQFSIYTTEYVINMNHWKFNNWRLIKWVTQAVRRGLNLVFRFDFDRWRHYYRILCKSSDSKWRQFQSILVLTDAEELQTQDFGLNF